jgi:hypothetical protein
MRKLFIYRMETARSLGLVSPQRVIEREYHMAFSYFIPDILNTYDNFLRRNFNRRGV